MRWLAIGLCCLCSLAGASRVWAQSTAASGANPSAAEDPAPRPAPQRISGAITNEPPQTERKLIPPYMHDVRGDVTTTAVFPFYFERRRPKDFERLIIPYYYRRGPKLNADVALGLVWSLRGPDRNTFVLPPFYTHRNGDDWAFGIPPLVMTGILKGHHHTIIPPLLTWIDGDKTKLHKVIGPYFEWESEHKAWWGVFPLLWNKKDDVDRFTLVPPFFFHFVDDDPLKQTTIVPPVYYLRRDKETAWGVPPLVFRKETPELKSTTVPLALFHYATGPEAFRLVTPVLAYSRSKKSGTMWLTPLYQRRRGDKNMDAVAPFVFRTWDNRDASTGLVIPPVYFHFKDPANDATVVFPFIGRWYHEGIGKTWLVPVMGHYMSFERDEQTWWVAPTFHYAWSGKSWQFNIHPLFYLKDSPEKWHLAIAPFWFDFRNHEEKTHRTTLFPLYWRFKNFAKQKDSTVAFPLWWDFQNYRKERSRRVGFPLYWDFEDRKAKKRTAVGFPLYYRFDRGDVSRTIVANTFYEKKKDKDGERWQFHFFPLTSFGRGKRDKWWSVLYGLAGYERRGKYRRIHVLYIPFTLR